VKKKEKILKKIKLLSNVPLAVKIKKYLVMDFITNQVVFAPQLLIKEFFKIKKIKFYLQKAVK
jgi:hypothetical protein